MPSEQHRAGKPSALGLLHPAGSPGTVRVLGTGPGRALAADTGDGAPGLVLLAGSASELRDSSWIEAAARLADTLAEDGVVVATGPSRSLSRALAGSGLAPTARLLHAPDLERSRYVFPLGGSASRFALGRLVPLRPAKRFTARVVASVLPSAFPAMSVAYRRAGSRPLFGWLAELGEPAARPEAIVARSWKASGATIVLRFAGGAVPGGVVKLGADVARETRTLRSLGAAARAASASVPEVLGELDLGGVPGLVETFVDGKPATMAILGSERVGREVLRSIADWLERWNAHTAVQRQIEPEDVQKLVLAPAERLADELPGDYFTNLRRLVDRCVGARAPFVAAHNDLTAANVLLMDGARIGVVDWHGAQAESLPLGDLAYAAADIASGVGGYRDRPVGYAAAFGGGGAFDELTRSLLTRTAGDLRLDPAIVDLCLQACWLLHADDERRDADGSRGGRPFLAILRQAAGQLRE